MTIERAVKGLGATDIFRDLHEDALRAIASKGVQRTFRKGQILFQAGDPSDHLYVVIEGRVKIYATSEDGAEMNLGLLEPPAVIGVVGLTDGGPRSASAEITEPTTLLAFSRAEFFSLLGEHPDLIESYLCELGVLLRKLQERTEDLVFLDLHGRVAKRLLQFADEGSDGDVLDLTVTQGDLAAMVGGTRQSVNQILKTFEGRGYLSIDGRRIVVRNRGALERLAGV